MIRSTAPPRGDELRERLVEIAEEILTRTGREDAVSMRAVADEVGCTATAIYRHFDDRTDLIFEVCRRLFAALEASVEEAVVGIGASGEPLADLRARGQAYIRFGLEHPEAYRVLFMGHAAIVPDDFDDEELLDLGGFKGVVASVRRCMEAGELADGDPFEVALVLWSGVHGLTSLLISKPWFLWPDREALIERVLDAQIDGLRGAATSG